MSDNNFRKYVKTISVIVLTILIVTVSFTDHTDRLTPSRRHTQSDLHREADDNAINNPYV